MDHTEFSRKGGQSKSPRKQESSRANAAKARAARATANAAVTENANASDVVPCSKPTSPKRKPRNTAPRIVLEPDFRNGDNAADATP